MSVPPRAPSRVGYRRPHLVRTNSSRNLFPDLAPIQTSPRLKYASDSDSDDDDDDQDGAKPLSVALPPLCPPSPISPTSSTSSSSLDSPISSSEDLNDYEHDPGCDGFPPPPLPQSSYLPPPPSQPPAPVDSHAGTLDESDAPPTLFHHGLSRSAFQTCRQFWDHRFHLWHAWKQHVDHLDAIQAEYARDGLRATLRYPPSPALPRTRDTPGQGANGIIPCHAQQDTEPQPPSARHSRLQTYNPYSPIFPRLGDLASLRDPYCDWPDRAFINFPTYSIAKMLFLNDMLIRDQQRRRRLHPAAEPHTPHSPESVYSDGLASPSAASSSSTATDSGHAESGVAHDLERPWEVDWRARWQVLIDRQAYPPQPYPPGSPHCPPHPSYAPGEGPPHSLTPVHSWSAPSPMSPVFAPPPPAPEQEGGQRDEEEERPFAWDATEDIPSLVPLTSPLTKVELEGEERPRTPVRGWRAGDGDGDGAGGMMPAPAPVVKLPTSGLKRASASTELSASYDPVPSCGRPRLKRTTRVDELARSVTAPESDSQDHESTAPDALREELPPRPASPAPMFYFYDEEEEEESGDSSATSFGVVRGPGMEAFGGRRSGVEVMTVTSDSFY
ncbi:hypothetical protein BV20DRAFT_973529 [Pilatotrama ljubarskyi]|nr:hypothetical protein BV20DRAFT_973529 [Pilatotrama ljubarskyi]